MNEKTFRSCMGLMQSLWGEVDPSVFKFFWMRFKSTPDDQFEIVTKKVLDSFKPTNSEKFPSPSRFVELLGQDEETRINLAVGAVRKAASRVGAYNSVSLGDRALHATIMHFGGWPAVVGWDDKEWKFREKSFIQAYRAHMHIGNGPVKLIGKSEADFDNYRSNISDEQRSAFQKAIEVKPFHWYGYQPLLENKSENVLEIADETSKLFDMDR